jgi:hypothetical protein
MIQHSFASDDAPLLAPHLHRRPSRGGLGLIVMLLTKGPEMTSERLPASQADAPRSDGPPLGQGALLEGDDLEPAETRFTLEWPRNRLLRPLKWQVGPRTGSKLECL